MNTPALRSPRRATYFQRKTLKILAKTGQKLPYLVVFLVPQGAQEVRHRHPEHAGPPRHGANDPGGPHGLPARHAPAAPPAQQPAVTVLITTTRSREVSVTWSMILVGIVVSVLGFGLGLTVLAATTWLVIRAKTNDPDEPVAPPPPPPYRQPPGAWPSRQTEVPGIPVKVIRRKTPQGGRASTPESGDDRSEDSEQPHVTTPMTRSVPPPPSNTPTGVIRVRQPDDGHELVVESVDPGFDEIHKPTSRRP